MNIAQLKSEKQHDDTPVDVIIRDRHGDPYVGKNGEPVVWGVVGEYAKVVRDFNRRANDEIVKAAQLGQKFDGEDSEDFALERLGVAVVSWKNMEDEAGNPIPCTPKNVAAVLKVGEWIVPQVSRVHRAHSGFFSDASDSSPSS